MCITLSNVFADMVVKLDIFMFCIFVKISCYDPVVFSIFGDPKFAKYGPCKNLIKRSYGKCSEILETYGNMKSKQLSARMLIMQTPFVFRSSTHSCDTRQTVLKLSAFRHFFREAKCKTFCCA